MVDTIPPFDYRKKFRNPAQLSQLAAISEEWGCSKAEVIYQFILDGFKNEKAKSKEIEVIKKYNNE